jgi:hypothetical protein
MLLLKIVKHIFKYLKEPWIKKCIEGRWPCDWKILHIG